MKKTVTTKFYWSFLDMVIIHDEDNAINIWDEDNSFICNVTLDDLRDIRDELTESINEIEKLDG